jgi:hypothetical protein
MGRPYISACLINNKPGYCGWKNYCQILEETRQSDQKKKDTYLDEGLKKTQNAIVSGSEELDDDH